MTPRCLYRDASGFQQKEDESATFANKNRCKTFHLFRADASQKVDQMMFFSGHMGILTASTKATPQKEGSRNKSGLTKGTMVVNNTFLRSHPHTPGGYPGHFTNSSVSQFLSLWGFGMFREVWGIFPGYVGKIIEPSILFSEV